MYKAGFKVFAGLISATAAMMLLAGCEKDGDGNYLEQPTVNMSNQWEGTDSSGARQVMLIAQTGAAVTGNLDFNGRRATITGTVGKDTLSFKADFTDGSSSLGDATMSDNILSGSLGDQSFTLYPTR